MDSLLQWRGEFPTLEKTVHLISHSLGAMPKRARERLQEYCDVWAERSIRAWDEVWWEMPRTVGDLIGRIIGAGEGEVVMHQNVSICQSMVLSCFDFTPKRNKIVSELNNFPTNLYIFHALEKQGARLHTVPSPDGIHVPLADMLKAIDEQTLLVSVSHVIFNNAFIQDLEALTKRAHEVGAYIIADIYQSAGTIPLDVRKINLDFATGGSVKWLCGGPGAGYLYVRRDLWPTLQPRLTGWLAHQRPFAFETGPIEYADHIYRFMHGSPAIPALYAARSGYEIINEIGVPAIRAKSQRQTKLLIELAQEAGFKINVPLNPDERGGTVIMDVPHGAQVTRELLQRDFLVDHRPGAGIRIAPHFYTKDEELTLVVQEIQQILSTKAYDKHPATSMH